MFYNAAMLLNEGGVRAEPIGPALHWCSWSGDVIRREATAGKTGNIGGRAKRRGHGKTDKEHRTASRMTFENNYRKESERLTRN